MVKANARRQGFAFNHYNPKIGTNDLAIAEDNAQGFTVNLSANSLEHANERYDLRIGPVVVVLPIDQTKTPAGRNLSVCPAAVRDDVTCASCGICAHPTHKAIIGFPAHGSGAKKAQAMFFAPRTMPTNYANLTLTSPI